MINRIRKLGVFMALLISGQVYAGHHEMAEPPRPAFSTTDTTLVTAVVEAIDYDTREVSLRRGDGEVITFTASDDVRNLSQVLVGDTLVAEHVVTFSVEVMPNDADLEPVAAALGAAVRSDEGDMPAGAIMGATMVTASVEEIDLESNTFKLRFADGVVQEFVARNPSNLERSKVGDLVVMTTTESVGIIVEHTTGSEE